MHEASMVELSEQTGCADAEGPFWLDSFLKATYFQPCRTHHFNKNDKNHFCIDCIEGPLCSRGLIPHANHRTLQVRRASHAEGVRVENINKLLDISGIQTYIINNHRIVFLVRLAKGKLAAKPGGHTWKCQTCGRVLSDPMKFCSIKCKVLAVRLGVPGVSRSLSLDAAKYRQPATFAADRFVVRPVETGVGQSDNVSSGEERSGDYLQRQLKRRRFDLPMNEKEHIRVDTGPLLTSPVSVLKGLSPFMRYALKHALGNPHIKLSFGSGIQSSEYLIKQSCDEGSESERQQMDMDFSALELNLIRRLLLASFGTASHRRKRRKGLPHRAPFS